MKLDATRSLRPSVCVARLQRTRRFRTGSISYVRISKISRKCLPPRRALRENERVWVRDAAGTLRIRNVEILWRRTEDVLVRNGFEAGDQVVTTNLTSIIPGMELAIRTTEAPSDPTEGTLSTSQP